MTRKLLRLLRVLAWLVLHTVYLAYLVAVRSFLYVTTLGIVVYFVVNSSYFRHVIVEVIAGEIPGRIDIENIQWGPLPWQTRIVGVDITEPLGSSVITADAVYAEVDLPQLFQWLTRAVALGGVPFELTITGADIRQFDVMLDMRTTDTPLLAYAFDHDEPSSPDSSGPVSVSVLNGNGVRGRCTILLPGLDQRYEDIDFSGATFSVGEDGLQIRSPLLVFDHGRATFGPELNPLRGEEVVLDVGATRIDEWVWDEAQDGFRVESVNIPLTGGRLVVSGSMGFPSGAPVRYDAEARLDLDQDAPLSRGLFDTAVRGPLSIWARGQGTFDAVVAEVQVASAALDVGGLPLQGVRAHGDLTTGVSGVAMGLRAAEASLLGGHVTVSDARLSTGDLEADGVVRLDGISPFELLTGPLVGLDPEGLDLLRARVTGTLRVTAALAAGPQVEVTILDQPLQVALHEPPARWPIAQTVEVEGAVGVDLGEGSVRARDLTVRSGEDLVHVDGSLALSGLTLDARVDVALPALRPWTTALGNDTVRGDLVLSDARVTGSVLAPDVAFAPFIVKGARFGTLGLGKVQGEVALEAGLLQLRGARASTDLGALALDGTVRLFEGGMARMSADFPFEISKLKANRVPLAKLSQGLSGTLTVTGAKVRGTLADPLLGLSASGHVVVTDVASSLQPLARAEADVRFERSRVRADGVVLVLPHGERLQADGVSWDLSADTVKARVRTGQLTLERLHALRASDTPLAGVVAADLTVEGRLSALRIAGEVSVTELGYDDIRLGDAAFVLSSKEPGRVAITSERFFHDWTLLPDAELGLGRDGVPEFLSASVKFVDQDLFEILPFARVVGLSNRLTGVAQMAIDFVAKDQAFGLDFSFEEGDIALSTELAGQPFAVRNKGPAFLMLGDGGTIWVQELTLEAPDGAVEVCGTFSPLGGQDLFVRAAVRLDFLGLFKDVFSVLEGSALTATDPIVQDRFGRSCLQSAPAHPLLAAVPDLGFAHVGGPLGSPTVVGALQLADARARLRSLGTEVVLDGSSRLELRAANEREVRPESPAVPPFVASDQVIRTPKDQPLGATYDDGRLSVDGRVRLVGWFPEELRLGITGVDIDYAAPHEYRVKVSPKLMFVGSKLSNEKARTLKLTGQAVIVEGSYHAGSSLGSSLIRSATGGRKLSAYTKSITESIPWLAPMVVDVEAVGENFAVRMKMPFGETDMELRIDAALRGTLGEPEVYGHIDVIAGGRIENTVFGRDFEVSKAGIDLNGSPKRFYIDTELRTEVTFREERGSDSLKGKAELASVSGGALPEEKTVVVRTRIKGTVDMTNKGQELAGVEVELDSDSGGYDRTELMYLLLTGAPSRQQLDESESAATINLLTGELANVIAKTLLGAFVDTVSLGVTVTGGFDWSLQKSLGRHLKFSVRGVQDDSGQRVQPNFQFKITDRLSLEGSLRFEQGQESQTGQAYETKLRYRIPLD